MDSTNATSEDDDLRIDWGAPDEVGAPAPEPALTLPPDLFGPGPPDPADEAPAALPVEEEPGFVLDELFGDEPEEPALPVAAGGGAPVVGGDLFSTATATAVKTRPRLAPERADVATPRPRRSLANRKLWISGAIVAGVVAVATLLNQPPDPSVNVRSAAPADPAPSVTASTRPLPSTTAAPGSSTTVATTPSTTTAAETGTGVTTPAPATTAAAAPRATVAPTPVTTAAPPPAPPTSTATTEPGPETTDPPPPDTTATTRRPRETIPPPTTAPSTTTTVEPEEVVEVD